MIGNVIGSYRIVGVLGKGGMGTVYVAEHALLGRKAAIKVLLPELSVRKDIVSRFFNEARAATSIHDVGIVQVFDFGHHTDGSAYIVMELLEGETLAARLRHVGPMRVDDAMRITRQIAASLGAAHGKRIVHRDLKPENVFLIPDAQAPGGERAKLLDFGIAKLAGDHPGHIETTTGAIMGTPAYMSPEQCRGAGEIDHRSDIYALGCVVFRMLTGRVPFEGAGAGDLIAMHLREPPPRPSALVSTIGPEADDLVLRCLQKSPNARFQTMHEVIAAMAALPAGSGNTAPALVVAAREPEETIDAMASTLTTNPPPPIPTTLGSSAGQITPPSRRRSPWRAIGAVFVTVTAIVTAYLALRSSAPDRDAVIAPPPPSSDAPILVDAPIHDALVDAAAVAPAVDAGAARIDAPMRRTGTARRLQPDAATPAATDPLDLDGDGVPDIRR